MDIYKNKYEWVYYESGDIRKLITEIRNEFNVVKLYFSLCLDYFNDSVRQSTFLAMQLPKHFVVTTEFH